jgi:hypothetical protein
MNEKELVTALVAGMETAREHMLPSENYPDGGDCDNCPMKNLCNIAFDVCDTDENWYAKLVELRDRL